MFFLSHSCNKNQESSAKIEENIGQSKEFKITFSKKIILEKTDRYLAQPSVPITNFICERSAGKIYDFYSEGDYWWPNPEDLDGPYIRRDGKLNLDNFTTY